MMALALGGAAVSGCNSNNAKGGNPDLSQVPSTDMAQSGNPDGGDGGGPTLGTSHKGTAIMSGAVKASSANFKVIMSLGQGPGDNKSAASANQKVHGGLVGATQPSKP